MRQARQAMRRWLRHFDVDVARFSTSAHARARRLLDDAAITVVLDVGANTGQYAQSLRAAGYAGRIVSFEPLPDAFARLSAAASRDPEWTALALALGRTRGDAVMHVAGNSVSSSLLTMAARHVQAAPASACVATRQVPLATLDDLRDDLLASADRVALKVDVQGYELEVLAGARRTLRDVQLLELELSTVSLYDGQPLLHEVLDSVHQQGFTLVNLQDGFVDPATGHLLQVDGTFLRR